MAQLLTCTTPPRILGYQEPGTCGYDFDPEQAQAFLAEAGYPEGEGFPILQFWFNRADYNEDVIEAVAAMWEENLGIKVELRTNEWAVYLDYLDAVQQLQGRDGGLRVQRLPHGLGDGLWRPAEPARGGLCAFLDLPVHRLGERALRRADGPGREPSSTRPSARPTIRKPTRSSREDEVAIIPIHGYELNTLVKNGVTFEYPPFGAPAFKHWALP